MGKTAVAVIFLVVIVSIALLMVESGSDFAIGTLFGVAMYQLAFKLNRDEFID